MKKIFILAVILAVLSGVLYLIMPYVRTTSLGAPSASTGNVQMTTARIEDESAAYTIDAQYPQFGLPAEASAQAGIASINAQIKGAVEGAVAEFKNLPKNPSDSATPKNEFTGSFDSVYVGPDIVSVKLILSQYTGGAHPVTLVSGVNYDRATGRLLLLDDALKLIGKSVGQVSAEATAELKAELGDAMFEEGANTNPENFSSFVISADKVTFIFQQYQVAPYAAGVQEVSFERKQ